MPSRIKSFILNHPIWHVAQNLACYLPGVDVLQRARTVTGAMNDPAVMAHWASLISDDVISAGKFVCDARFVEVGPGHSLGVSFGLLAAGAKEIYAIDVRKYADLSDYS